MEYVSIDQLFSIGFIDVKDMTNMVTLTDKPENNKKINKYNKDYDEKTMSYYTTLRQTKLDVLIPDKPLNNNNAFIFPYIWDPINGERHEHDPYGPLYFDVYNLIYYFYVNRVTHLWNNESDEECGYFEGHYEYGVGAGKKFTIQSRGDHPEFYLFRLPIPNCYLINDHDSSIITMGPELTNNEVLSIYNLACSNKNKFKTMFTKDIPDITLIKKVYDIAISNTLTYKIVSKIKWLPNINEKMNECWIKICEKILLNVEKDCSFKKYLISNHLHNIKKDLNIKYTDIINNLLHVEKNIDKMTKKYIDNFDDKNEIEKLMPESLKSEDSSNKSFKSANINYFKKYDVDDDTTDKLINMESDNYSNLINAKDIIKNTKNTLNEIYSINNIKCYLTNCNLKQICKILDDSIIKYQTQDILKNLFEYINREAVQYLRKL